MRVAREIDSQSHLVILTVSGKLTDQGLLRLYDELRETEGLTPDFELLIDLRQADGREVSTAAVTSLAERPLLLSPESRRAVVVTSEFGFGMARMYELLRDAKGGEIRVFRDFDEARLWLD
jgi:hypothetical protein